MGPAGRILTRLLIGPEIDDVAGSHWVSHCSPHHWSQLYDSNPSLNRSAKHSNFTVRIVARVTPWRAPAGPFVNRGVALAVRWMIDLSAVIARSPCDEAILSSLVAFWIATSFR